MQQILVPTDFSADSLNALKYALEVADHFDGEVTLLHAFEAPLLAPSMTTTGAGVSVELLKIAQERDEDQYELYKEKVAIVQEAIGKSDIPVHFKYSDGLAVEQIVAESKTGNYDLIAMSTEGADGIGRWLHGTHAASVVQRSRIPVLVVPDEARFKPIERMAFATNFEHLDDNYVDTLVNWVVKLEAELHFIHVANKKQYIDLDQYHNMEEIKAIADKYDNIKFRILYDDDILDQLEDYAEDNSIDLMAMVTERLPFYKRIFNPSLTQQMTFETEIPLLVFHADQ